MRNIESVFCRIATSSFLVFLLLLMPMSIAWAQDSITFGVFPRRNAQVTTVMFTPMVKHLSDQLGVQVKLEVSKDFESFWEGVTKKKYDIVHFNQYHYIKSARESGYRVILKNEEFGKDTISNALIVRKDGDISSVEDLRDKKIIFGGGPSAMVSYILNTHLLRQSGLNRGDYQEEYAISPPNAVFASYYGHADASGASNIALQLGVIKKRVDTTELKYLVTGEVLPHLPWAVNSSMTPALSKKIQTVLFKLKKDAAGKKILKTAGLTGLNIANDAEYDAHRTITKAVTNEDYCVRNCDVASFGATRPDKKLPLYVSIFPRREKRKTFDMFKPVADYLAKELNREVILETHKTFKALWRGIKDRRYDIIHVNQFQYVKSHKLYGYDVILKNEEHGATTITPSIYVRKNSGIETLQDLRGKHVIFGGGKLAMVSYVGNLQLLQNAGLKDGDYTWNFANTPPNGCRAMFLGQADACGAATVLQKMPVFKNMVDIEQVRVLAENVPLTNVNWAVKGSLGDATRQQIQKTLLKLNQTESGKKILKKAGMSGLVAASEQEYDIHRNIIYDVLKEKY